MISRYTEKKFYFEGIFTWKLQVYFINKKCQVTPQIKLFFFLSMKTKIMCSCKIAYLHCLQCICISNLQPY